MAVSIIIPVIRPEKAARCITAIKKNAGSVEYEIVAEEDVSGIGAPKMIKHLTGKTKNDLVMFLGDDTVPHPGFLDEAIAKMETLPDGWGVVGLNSGGGNYFAHWLAHKKMLPGLNGEFMATAYKHCWCDNELAEVAQEMGRYTVAPKSIIEHLHPVFQTAPDDEGYQKAYSKDYLRSDLRTYLRRRKARGSKKVGIGLPLTYDKEFVSFFLSFFAMEKPDSTLYVPTFPGHHDDLRNNLVTQALNDGVTHLIMMDTDQVYPLDTITKLLSHDDVKAVGAVVHRRWPPFDPILYAGELEKYKHVPLEQCYSGDVLEVAATGCGCMMYDTEVFLDIEMPWFEIGTGKDGKGIGEDIMFCSKLQNIGVKIYVDTSIEIDHLTIYRVNRSTHELFKAVHGFQYNEESVNVKKGDMIWHSKLEKTAR